MELFHFPRKEITLFDAVLKHPFVWAGAGMLVRYAGETDKDYSFQRKMGVLVLAAGFAHLYFQRVEDAKVP